MAFPERQTLIAELEKVRGSRVVSFVLADRETFPPGIPGFAMNLAGDSQIHLIDQLKTIGRAKQLDLFLYTRGGATDAVWPLVSVLRKHCERLAVIVPFRAHSAGTLIALAADEIILSDDGELSPIDPTTGNQFNPTDPTNPQQRFGISVEDVTSYFALARERAGLTEQSQKLDVFKELTSKVHPLALGNVERVYSQIRSLARKLLGLHLDADKDVERIDAIIKALTEKFYSHVHAINREEAIALLGEWVRPPSPEEDAAIGALFESYLATLGLRSRFSLPRHVADQVTTPLTAVGGFLDTSGKSHVHVAEMTVIQRPNLPPNVQVQVPPGGQVPLVPWASRSFEYSLTNVGWKENNDGT